MAKFKITKTTTVAELKEQFRSEFGGTLRVYEGRSEAPEDATLVSLGGKVDELECRASRTVGKFEEAFQSELGLKVKVYTKDNWVSVLDGITLATVREIPKSATKAKMEQFLAYQRDEKEEETEEAKADEVEIPEEYKGVPIIEIEMTEIDVNDEELEDWDFPQYPTVGVVFHGYESNASQGCVIVADNHSELCETAKEFIDSGIGANEDIPVRIIETKKIKGYGEASDVEELKEIIGCALNEYYDGGNKHSYYYEWEDWFADKAIFIVDDDVFMGYSDGGIDFIDLDDKQIEALKTELMMPSLDELKFDEETKVASFKLGDKYGVINTEGTIVVPAIYDEMSSFTNGMAMVKLDRKEGYINPKGEAVIPIEYERIGWLSEGLIEARKDGKYGYLDINGNVVIPFVYDEVGVVKDGLINVCKDDQYGYIDIKGNVVIPFEYDDARDFNDGIAIVKKDNHYGFINKTGAFVIEPRYDGVEEFRDGCAAVRIDRKWGLINAKGEFIVAPVASESYGIRNLEGDNFVIKVGYNKYGIMGKDNKWIVEPIYEDLSFLRDGLIAAKKDGKYGFINLKGEVVIPMQYDRAWDFSDGKAEVELNGEEFKIDTNGNRVE